MTFLIRDYENSNVDLVIQTKTTTMSEIETIISDVKNTAPDSYTLDDLIESLPEDCEILLDYENVGKNSLYF